MATMPTVANTKLEPNRTFGPVLSGCSEWQLSFHASTRQRLRQSGVPVESGARCSMRPLSIVFVVTTVL
jgi:hypothetical protein